MSPEELFCFSRFFVDHIKISKQIKNIHRFTIRPCPSQTLNYYNQTICNRRTSPLHSELFEGYKTLGLAFNRLPCSLGFVRTRNTNNVMRCRKNSFEWKKESFRSAISMVSDGPPSHSKNHWYRHWYHHWYNHWYNNGIRSTSRSCRVENDTQF